MVDNIDNLVLLMRRCDGKHAAIMSYEEETDAGHAEAVRAVEKLARKHGIVDVSRIAWRAAKVIVVLATFGILYILWVAPP